MSTAGWLIGAAGLALAGGSALLFSAGPVPTEGPTKSVGKAMTGEKVLGWAIDADGRLTEGPFKGFLTRSPQREDKLVLSEAEWKARLTAEQFRILRNHGTEAAFCGVFHDHKADGYYKVVTTEHRVFKSDAKFDSGTGWPSFFQPYDRDAIWLRPDFSYGMTRMEVLDSLTDGHLGHVFEDGPRDKSGLRFCINSEVLEFVPAKL